MMVWSLFIIDLMGLFFYNKNGSIISIGDLPTTNIIEPVIYNLSRVIRLPQSGQDGASQFSLAMISLWVSILTISIIWILGSLMSSSFVIKCNCSI